jgi:PPOX class probable F420-dependent enzyme
VKVQPNLLRCMSPEMAPEPTSALALMFHFGPIPDSSTATNCSIRHFLAAVEHECRFLGGEAGPSRAVSARSTVIVRRTVHVLSDHERTFLLTRPVGHLATADSGAVPHVVPVCFAISQDTLYFTIDEKPKRVAGGALKRVRNIERNPMVAIVVDRYDEDWSRLGWVMLRGRAEILRAGKEHDRAQELLRARYRQLAAMQIAEQPVIAVRLERVTSWGNLSVGADEAGHDGQA